MRGIVERICRDIDTMIEAETLSKAELGELAGALQSRLASFEKAPVENKAPSYRDCACLGSCKGAAGLAPGWRCVLGYTAENDRPQQAIPPDAQRMARCAVCLAPIFLMGRPEPAKGPRCTEHQA